MTAIVILLALLAVLIPALSMQRRRLAAQPQQPQSEGLRKVMLGVIVALAILGVVLLYLLVSGT